MRQTLILSLASAIALAGCASVPKLGAAPKPTDAGAYATTQSFSAPAVEWPADRWWAAYGDSQLNALMDEALSGAPSLKEAAARLRSAQARSEQAKAATLPSLTATASAAENKQSYNYGFPRSFLPQGYNDVGQLHADLAYDLDLWGKNRAALKAATSEAEAARMDAAEARLVLTTSLAAAYADFARLQAERDAAADAAKNRATSADLVARQLDNGYANRGEADQAKAAAASPRLA
jgi:outer membrane protein TolC